MQHILHTGDMRWKPSLADVPALRDIVIDILFLDTTYSNARHTHPPQVRCPAASPVVAAFELVQSHWKGPQCRGNSAGVRFRGLHEPLPRQRAPRAGSQSMHSHAVSTTAAQDEAIAAMVGVMRAAKRQQPRTLFVVGSYHIGGPLLLLSRWPAGSGSSRFPAQQPQRRPL